MSALAKMAIDMILKEVPLEARQMINNALTPESLDKVSHTIMGLLAFVEIELPKLREDIQLIRGNLERIEGELTHDYSNSGGVGSARNLFVADNVGDDRDSPPAA